jgi:hypothetical protein
MKRKYVKVLCSMLLIGALNGCDCDCAEEMVGTITIDYIYNSSNERHSLFLYSMPGDVLLYDGNYAPSHMEWKLNPGNYKVTYYEGGRNFSKIYQLKPGETIYIKLPLY